MQTRRPLWLILFTMALAACAGGSGSSGFEATSENAAISQALDEQRCVMHETLTICPANETLPTPPPAPSPTEFANATATAAPLGAATQTPTQGAPPPTQTPAPTSIPRIDTGVSPTNQVPCTLTDDSICILQVPFAPQGFPQSAVFRVAARIDSSGQWMISAESISHGSVDMPNFDGTVQLTGIGAVSTANVSVQLAVLVFLHPPGMLPAEVDQLADTKADDAFVTAELTLEPVTSP